MKATRIHVALSNRTLILFVLLSLAVLLTHTCWPTATVQARSYVAPPTTCNDAWAATTTAGAPAGRTSHTAVWTGTEMIVWGGQGSGPYPDFPNTESRYNPATDTWTPTSTTNAPATRIIHTAIWTGTEMIVWGGLDSSFTELNTGGRYNPATDTWTAISTTNAPAARQWHTAIWTGTEMIVWGGLASSGRVNTGGRYNPATDTWTPTNTTNAPATRHVHTAVWTGTEMIVWGGDGGSGRVNTGGRYNPATDSWTTTNTTNAPTEREQHTAVWTGNEMIVWGGLNFSVNFNRFNTGGRYNPATDSWIATSTTNAPSERQLHTGAWAGNEMIVWGGYDGITDLNTGGRYDPTTDSWTTTSTIGAPAGRRQHTAVWTNSEMIVWGGGANFNTGGRYCGGSSNTAPVARCQNVTVTADATNTANASINDGSSDPDGDPLTLTQSPPGPYPVGMNSVMLTVTDGRGGSSTCSANVTVTAFGQPPGDPAPVGTPPTKGSVLIYNYYASDAVNPALENTTLELTNNHSTVATFVHVYFIAGNSCSVADLFACLAPGQTISFLVSDLDPGNKGYIVAFSTDGNGVPNNFNFLSGSAAVKLASGHHAEFDALAIEAIAAVPATADFNGGAAATVNFDGIHYARVPRALELDPVYSTGDGAETILVVNSLSGSLFTGVTAIGAFQGVLTNHDTGSQFSFTGSAGCQLNQLLSDAFPLTSPVFSAALPAKDDGNLKLWANADQGICGVVLNRNPTKKGKKFNSGDNLRAVTVTSSTLIVPVFEPAC